MRTKILGLIGLFLVGITGAFAKEKSENIQVKGNCEMCKERIEKAAKTNRGVSTAIWGLDTQNLVVSYDDKKTSSKQIQTSVTMVGYDTELFRASDAKYTSLPKCCQYVRGDKKAQSGHETNQCSGGKQAATDSCCEGK